MCYIFSKATTTDPLGINHMLWLSSYRFGNYSCWAKEIYNQSKTIPFKVASCAFAKKQKGKLMNKTTLFFIN